MTNRVACQASDIYAAFAPVSGLYTPHGAELWPSTGYECKPNGPVPVLHMPGLRDPIVPYAGRKSFGFPPVREYIQGWARRNSIAPGINATRTYSHKTVQCESWGEGRANVTLCTAAEAGHSWPGAPTPACPSFGPFKCTRDINATDHIWAFFERYTLHTGN